MSSNTKYIKVLIVLKARKLRIRDNTRGRTRSLETFDLMKGHIGYYEVSFDYSLKLIFKWFACMPETIE